MEANYLTKTGFFLYFSTLLLLSLHLLSTLKILFWMKINLYVPFANQFSLLVFPLVPQ